MLFFGDYVLPNKISYCTLQYKWWKKKHVHPTNYVESRPITVILLSVNWAKYLLLNGVRE